MKHYIKTVLLRTGVLDYVRFIYNGLRGISLDAVYVENQYRSNGLPDGYPVPPMKLVFLVIGSPWAYEYWLSGLKIVDDISDHIQSTSCGNGVNKRILDFGCGCGRLTRHLTRFKGARIYGSDYNPVLIEWCSKNLTFGEFSLNNSEPPLKYESGTFDLVIARSVFTHLGFDSQQRWMEELYRVLSSQGILYFTTHGRNLIRYLNEREVQTFDSDELVVQYQQLEGDNKCTSFESKNWVIKHLQGNFEFVNFIEGKSDKHLQQDAYIFRKP